MSLFSVSDRELTHWALLVFYFKFTLGSCVQCHSTPVQHGFPPFRGQVSRAGWTQGIRRCTAFLCHVMCVHTSSSHCHSLKFVYMCINPRGLTLERSCSESSPSQMPEGPRKAHVGPLLQGDSNSPHAAWRWVYAAECGFAKTLREPNKHLIVDTVPGHHSPLGCGKRYGSSYAPKSSYGCLMKSSTFGSGRCFTATYSWGWKYAGSSLNTILRTTYCLRVKNKVKI